jgi:hypothetical protein
MEAVEFKKKAGRNRQLTERDRELCGLLAVCRYLTREQIERLMFPGRSKARSSTRLRQLMSRMGGQAAVLRGDLGYTSAEGWTTVWALTAEGFEIGSQLLNLKLTKTPKHDVGPWFLKHEVMLNEVFLGLVPQDGNTPAKLPRGFRWVLGEYLDLSFDDFTREARSIEKRRLQPDAILEDLAGRRRYFIEYETGSATVRDAKKSTSTMAKLDRYGTFFRAPASNPFAGEHETFYERAFRDGWPAEVLFVTPSEARRDSIARVITVREHSDKYKFAARALTLAESRSVLCRALYGADQPPGIAQQGACSRASAPPPPSASADVPARTAAEERLRRGRVSVRGEQLVKFEKLLRSSLSALSSAQEVLNRLRVPNDAIPGVLAVAPETMRVLAEYARRGHEALFRHGLREAE